MIYSLVAKDAQQWQEVISEIENLPSVPDIIQFLSRNLLLWNLFLLQSMPSYDETLP